MTYILGLDIGGANTKACYLKKDEENTLKTTGGSVYHEMWKNPEGLRDVLTDFENTFKLKENNLDGIALTMTAELCDKFESKTQGVRTILKMVEESFSGVPIYIWTTRGAFVNPSEIKNEPLQAAASNWLASAVALAHSPLLDGYPAILVDMGSTTTDILPLSSREILVKGRTDTERLLHGELLYTGILRTAVDAIVGEVYIDGRRCQIAHEYFAISADVYRYLGQITEKEYYVPTPDGGERNPEGCAKRLARVVASEPEELGMKNIYWMARAIQERQTEQILENILCLVSRREMSPPKQLIMAGQGSFILKDVAERLGWKAVPWWKIVPGAKPQLTMSSYAVAWLLLRQLSS